MRKNRSSRKSRSSLSKSVSAEVLEYRRMLSAIPNPQVTPTDGALPQTGGLDHYAAPDGYSPQQIRGAYGISNISFDGITGDGSGQTIAIIVAYDDPMFVDSTDANFDNSDLHMFDEQFGLPDPPSFKKVDEDGGTDYPGTNSGWANETALDVEWAHAIAPEANILLVEAASTNLSDLIEGAAQYASGVQGVSVITMSFAVSEFMGETSYDSFLESPTGHNITFVAASGDNGDQGGYPADSPNVVAVGATSLQLSGDSYVSESGTNSSGGGISEYESKPSYQFGETKSSDMRTTPDVSIDGYPYTGASVYDSFNGGSSLPWYNVGGTSLSAPLWASMMSIADQGRAQIGLSALDGLSQTLPRLYSLSSSDFHDITTGNNGFAAGTGYDLVTGLGTPIANKLVPDLAGGNAVTGTVFGDSNDNGVQNTGENGIPGVSVFTDLYNSGVYEGADQEVTSNSTGAYDFTDLPGGTYKIAAVTPSGYKLTTPGSYSVTGSFGSSSTGKNFGYQATAVATEVQFSEVPLDVTAGAAITPSITVDVDDSSGAIVASDDSMVTLSIANGSATIGGTLTERAVDGVATFSGITLSLAGSDMLLATDGSLSSATSSAITVTGNTTAPVGSHLIFLQQPSTASTGAAITPSITVDVEDSNGNIITTDGSPVTLVLASGTNTLGGTLTENAVNGVATFSDVTLSTAGTVTLNASDGALTPITSQSFSILAIPTSLSFGTVPSDNVAGEALVPVLTVSVLDGGGNLVTTDDSPVTLAVATGSGTLGGTVTVNAVNGVATFNNITLSAADTYTLTATDGSLTAATSDIINVGVPGILTPAVVRNTLATSLVAGSKVKATVIVDITNSTANVSTGTVTTNIYATAGGGQILLGTVSRKASIKAKKSVSISVPITMIPSSLGGSYILQAQVVDPARNIQNFTGASVKVTAPFVSLSETVTKITLPAAVISDARTKALALVKITNEGNIPSAGITTTRIYASPDGLADDGILLNSITRPMTIKPGASLLLSVPLTQIPASLNGTYSIVAEVTDPNAVRTSVNSGVTLKVAPAFVDLSATISAPNPVSLAPGKSASITVTIANSGNVASTGPATINLGLTVDSTTELPGSVTTTHNETIPVGKSIILHLKIVIPAALTAGSYFPFLKFTQALSTVTTIGTTALTVT